MNISNSSFSIFKRDIVIYISNFITAIIISRKLGLISLGIWSILRLIASYGEVFGRTRAEHAAVYFIGKKKFDKGTIFYSLNFILLCSFVFLGILIFFNYQNIYSFFFRESEMDYFLEFNFTLLSVPFQLIFISYVYFFIALQDFDKFNKITIFNNLFITIFTFLSLTITSFGLKGISIVYFLGPLLSIIYALFLLPRNLIYNVKFNIKAIFDLFSYGLQFFFTALLTELQSSGSRLITAYFLAPSYVAFLGQGQKYSQLIDKSIDPIRVALLPKISRSSKSNSVKITCKAFKVSFIISSFICILMALFIKPLIIILYGNEFQNIANVIYIIIPGVLLKNSSSFFITYFSGSGKEFINVYLQVLPAILQIVLGWYFIRSFGFYGACLSTLICLLVISLIYIIYFLRINNLKFYSLTPSREDFIYVLRFAVSKIKNILSSSK